LGVFNIGFEDRRAGEQNMEITKAVITAARRTQRSLPLQTIIDSDGVEKSVLRILVEEVIDTGVDEICVIVHPGDEAAYAATVGEHAGRLQFVQQTEQLGYAHAVHCAREFVGRDAFLHLVGDHLYVRPDGDRCAARVVEVARAHACSVSAVQATRETLLPYFGTVGGHRLAGQTGLYQVETVIEKPTPTEAEQRLVASGLRAGHYLCFFGIHVLTAGVMEILDGLLSSADAGGADARPNVGLSLSAALNRLAQREQYLALEQRGMRLDIGVKYGLLSAQIALALNGRDRDEMLTRLLELLMERSMQEGEGPV
jgi:UTP--glucose-1-phosphate uridylyltransferase